ncbi:Probable calcium-binding protein CML26 [Linum grandiflorum]
MGEPIAAIASPTTTTPSADELQKVFDKFDTNGDGKISASELAGVLRSMGTEYSAPDLQRAMEEIDSDKDGFINLEEFAQLCRDENKDGLVSEAELHHVLNRIGMRCSVEECARMIKGVDSDGDGRVNYKEFEKMMASKKN